MLFLFEESTTVISGYLTYPVMVEVHRQRVNRVVLFATCDLALYAAVGRSRSRTPLAVVRMFVKLRAAAFTIRDHMQLKNDESDAVDPTLALARSTFSSACARSRSGRRPARNCVALCPGVVEVLVGDVVPPAFPDAASLTTITLDVVPRARATPLVYVLDSEVKLVISCARHELCACND